MKEIIRLEKDLNLIVPDEPDVEIPQRKHVAILGQMTHQVKELDKKAAGQKGDVETRARERWKNNEDMGIGSCSEIMQRKDAPAVDDLLLGTRIEFLSEFDMDNKGTIRELR